MLLRKTAVEILFDKEWRPKNYNNMRLILDELKLLLYIYNNAKEDSVGVIQGCIYQSKLSLLEGKIPAREM